MKIAITGATGFIGRHLTLKHLEMGDEVRILSRKPISEINLPTNVEVFNGDLLSDFHTKSLFLENVDVLYHCAAEIKDDSQMFRVNVEGTKKLIELAKGKIKHWVQLSTTGIYGPLMDGKIYETQKLNPTNKYEISKQQSDEAVINAASKAYFTYSILRPSNVFGPDMGNQSLFQLIKAVDKGYFFFIGTVDAKANYVPVENVVHAMILLGTNDMAKGKIYNISDSMPLEKFIQCVAKFLNKPMPRVRLPLFLMRTLGLMGDLIAKFPLTSGRVNALTIKAKYEIDLIEKELNYRPQICLEKGIENLVQEYKIQNSVI